MKNSKIVSINESQRCFILKEAVSDLRTGRSFYSNTEKGVGNYFWDSLIADIESLVIYAGIHNKKSEFYCMPVKRFPYAIYYEINNDTVYVTAILPMRRDPAWIKNKLTKTN